MRTPTLVLATALWSLSGSGCSDSGIRQAPPKLVLSERSVDFGRVAIGFTGGHTLMIENQGENELQVSTRYDPPDIFSDTKGDLAVGVSSSTGLPLVFSPQQVTSYQGLLTLLTNDPAARSVEIQLAGEGFRQGELRISPLELDFGLVNQGEAAVQTLLFESVGEGAVVLSAIRMAEGTDPAFQVLSSTKTPATLESGTQVSLRVAYRPGLGSLPPQDGSLLISVADPLDPLVSVTLKARLNQAPIADAGPDLTADPAQEVILDGAVSQDPDGDLPLTYAWALKRQPEGSRLTLAELTSPQLRFTPELIGLYEAELRVIDGRGLTSLLPDRVAVNVVPKEKLVIELVWDSPIADLDLHLLAPGGTVGSPLDCFLGNRKPDWGTPGDPSDNPWLKRDDLAGFGPEIIVYPEPVPASYRIWVGYYASHTASGKEPCRATLRVTVYGQLKAELTHYFQAQNEGWDAATLDWPTGTVSTSFTGTRN